MKTRLILQISLVLAIQFMACKKDDPEPADTTGPSIAVSEPVNGSVYQSGDTIFINATFSDNSGLQTIDVNLRDPSGNVIWHPSASFVPGATSFQLLTFVVNNISDTTVCTLEFSASDQKGNSSSTTHTLTLLGSGNTLQTVSSQDFASGIQLITEAVHICDMAAFTGTYGPCGVVITSAFNTSDADTLTVDFGTGPCLDSDGRYRSGKIRVIYSGGNYFDSLVVKQMSFINYVVNDAQVNGSSTITNAGRVQGYNTYVLSEVGGVAFPAYNTAINSNLTLAQYAGESTGTFADDGWYVSGSASGIDRDGRSYTAQITAPLFRVFSCWNYFTMGTVQITPVSSQTQILDYGSLACDNQATVTVGFNTFMISLF